MPLPVLLAVDDDRDALDDVETQLAQRYAHDYRIESVCDPDEALRMLQELAEEETVAADALFVLIGPVRTLTGCPRRSQETRTGSCSRAAMWTRATGR